MEKKSCFYIFLLFVLLTIVSYAKDTKNTLDFSCKYFDSKLPEKGAKIFAEGVVSTKNQIEFGLYFDSDMKKFSFSRLIPGKGWFIFGSKKKGNNWEELKKIKAKFRYSFDGKYKYIEKVVDGKNPNKRDADFNLWISKKEKNSWSELKNFGRPNNVKGHWNPFISVDGYIYFNAPNKDGKNNIFYTKLTDNGFGKIVLLEQVSTNNAVDVEPVVSPDGTYMVFYSAGRKDNFSSKMVGDLYVSFKLKNGTWSKAFNLGDKINSPREENFATFSPDGKFLFFSSNKESTRGFPSIYWIKTSFVYDIKNKYIID